MDNDRPRRRGAGDAGDRPAAADLGLGGALGAAMSNLSNEPVLSFGIAAAIVAAGIVGSALSGSWLVVAIVAGLCLVTLITWGLSDGSRRDPRPRISRKLKMGPQAGSGGKSEVQQTDVPASARVEVRNDIRLGRGSRIEDEAKVQGLRIHGDASSEDAREEQ
jgi:hypothetical protein